MLTVPNELALTESRTMRAATMDRTDVLDKVKALVMLPDGVHVTTETVAGYYEVDVETIKKLVQRNRGELAENGLNVLRGEDLRNFERDNLSLSIEGSHNRRALTIFNRSAILNVGMLLADSEVAKKVRTYLIEAEAGQTAVSLPQQAPAAMELALRVIGLQDRVMALTTSNDSLSARVAEMSAKAEGYDDLIAADGYLDMSSVAKILAPVTGGLGRTRLLNLLRGMGIILQGSTLPEQKLIERGYFAVRTDMVNGKAVAQTVVSPKGLRWLQAELREDHPTLTRLPQPNVVQLPQQSRGELA
jgi:phage antirepressor YoqD-like protein